LPIPGGGKVVIELVHIAFDEAGKFAAEFGACRGIGAQRAHKTVAREIGDQSRLGLGCYEEEPRSCALHLQLQQFGDCGEGAAPAVANFPEGDRVAKIDVDSVEWAGLPRLGENWASLIGDRFETVLHHARKSIDVR